MHYAHLYSACKLNTLINFLCFYLYLLKIGSTTYFVIISGFNLGVTDKKRGWRTEKEGHPPTHMSACTHMCIQSTDIYFYTDHKTRIPEQWTALFVITCIWLVWGGCLLEQGEWVPCQSLELHLALVLVQAVLVGPHSQMVLAAVVKVSQVSIFGKQKVLVLWIKNMSLSLTFQRKLSIGYAWNLDGSMETKLCFKWSMNQYEGSQK
jgi:hypothetical protein